MSSITSEQADRIITTGRAHAAQIRVAAIITVLDAGVHLKAFARMDGAVLGSIDLAIGKARTAALFATSSEAVWDYCKPGAAAHHLELSNGGLYPFAGGLPLIAADGTLFGSVGVSGGTVSQDLEIAQAAAAALQTPSIT